MDETARALAEGDLSPLSMLSPSAGSLQLILTHLHATTDPSAYLSFLETIPHSLPQLDDQLLPGNPLGWSRNLPALVLFLIHRSYQIFDETGSMSLIHKLLSPFTQLPLLDNWMASIVAPATFLQYRYPALARGPRRLEEFSVSQGIDFFRSTILETGDVEVLTNALEPWMHKFDLQVDEMKAAKETSSDAWDHFFPWLLQLLSTHPDLVVRIFQHWPSPGDRVIQTGLSCVWTSDSIKTARKIMDTLKPETSPSHAAAPAIDVSDFAENFLSPRNGLTSPKNIQFAKSILALVETFGRLHVVTSMSQMAKLSLFGDAAEQLDWLKNAIATITTTDCASVRTFLLDSRQSTLTKVNPEDLAMEILSLCLRSGNYELAASLYDRSNAKIEQKVADVVLHLYDTASNGNRTRGNMKKASALLQAFPSSSFESLLSATHSLSFYSLSEGGAPLPMKEIRSREDPLSLISMVLEQNPRSYTHLDDMIGMGQQLAKSEVKGTTTRARVEYMVIMAALAEDDFETAYSYIVNRLSNSTGDDWSWRAALAAGQYAVKVGSSTYLRRLEQRMEILSQALRLAPPTALPDLLQVWQACERDLADLLAEESPEPSPLVPGGFVDPHSSPSRHEKAPLGLFDVARGAASALTREQAVDHAGERIRKRDMVSNLVTGGLVSGIGWVIGESLLTFQD